MAKQESYLKVRGKMGDLSFTKHRTRGYEVRVKGGVDKERIMNDPNYQRTRENMSEFASAVRKGKQLRRQVHNLTRFVADKTMINRMTSLVHRIQKADKSSDRGARQFLLENSRQLKGFEFNKDSSLKSLIAHELLPVYDRELGTLTLELPAFTPLEDVLLLDGATHMQFILAATQLNADEVLPRPLVDRSDYIPLVGKYAGSTLELQLEPDLDDVLCSLVGIMMFQQVNDGHYSLNNVMHNALTVVEVDIP